MAEASQKEKPMWSVLLHGAVEAAGTVSEASGVTFGDTLSSTLWLFFHWIGVIVLVVGLRPLVLPGALTWASLELWRQYLSMMPGVVSVMGTQPWVPRLLAFWYSLHWFVDLCAAIGCVFVWLVNPIMSLIVGCLFILSALLYSIIIYTGRSALDAVFALLT